MTFSLVEVLVTVALVFVGLVGILVLAVWLEWRLDGKPVVEAAAPAQEAELPVPTALHVGASMN
jgi:hypothetical protein